MWWEKLIQPRVVVPVLLSVAALAFVFSVADVPVVMDRITHMPMAVLAGTYVLVLAYLALKILQFSYFLGKLQIPTTPGELIVAYGVGEMALSLPGGIYAQNYVLGKVGHLNVARSLAATTAVLMGELVIALLVLLVVEIPGWWWLRWSILSLLAAAVLFVVALLKIRALRRWIDEIFHIGPLRQMEVGFLEVLQGMGDLARPGIALRSLLTATVYLFVLVGGFYLTGHGVGVGQLTFQQATTIYLFAVAATEILPISSHVGIIELGGVSAAQAWGYSFTEGLAMMLGFRLVWTGSVWLTGGVALFIFRDEFKEEAEPG